MAGVGLAPGCPVAAEDVRNLKRRTRHDRRRLIRRFSPLLKKRKPVERAHHLADRGGGHARVERGRVKLGVSQQKLDNTDINNLLEKMGRKAVPERVQRDGLADLRQLPFHSLSMSRS